ncbi:MAG: hypothetical protein JSU63_16005 [Phycisphaerales bacterium]|nr:MAG: hypothetical protein JSU63_16005 [Phycisphaerales bacterium]
MMRLLLAATTALTYSGCPNIFELEFDPGPQIFVYNIHIAKGGGGSFRLEWLDIRSSKTGEEGKKNVEEFIAEFKREDRFESELPGCDDVSHDVGYDSQGVLNAHVQGRIPDIFVLLRMLQGSSPASLRGDEILSLGWDGDVLSVKLGPRSSRPPRAQANEDSQLKIIITTEGKFLSATHGSISDDRKKLVISGAEALAVMNGQWGFSIAELAWRGTS